MSSESEPPFSDPSREPEVEGDVVLLPSLLPRLDAKELSETVPEEDGLRACDELLAIARKEPFWEPQLAPSKTHGGALFLLVLTLPRSPPRFFRQRKRATKRGRRECCIRLVRTSFDT